jgi:hypothetical protein
MVGFLFFFSVIATTLLGFPASTNVLFSGSSPLPGSVHFYFVLDRPIADTSSGCAGIKVPNAANERRRIGVI